MIVLNRERDISPGEWDGILKELGLEEKLRRAERIVIKPNFAAGSYASPAAHVMTDLRLLSGCISCLARVNVRAPIHIVEGDSTGAGFAYLKFEHLNLPQSLDVPNEIRDRVFLTDLTRDRLIQVEDERLKYFRSDTRPLYLSETLMGSDFRVSLSNLKTHSVTGFTGACKNLFGCLPDMDKSVYHPHIARVVHDLTVVCQPDLSVVDAFCGMEKNGPVQGIDVDSGYRVFSDNAVEADIYAAQSIGCPPAKVRYLRLLKKTFCMEDEVGAPVIRLYARPGLFLRCMNACGLFIQRLGQAIATFGHRVHGCPSFLTLLIAVFRPVLVRCFDMDKLKSWKRKIMK